MYDIKLRYLASVFVDADSIVANAENITGLIKALDDPTFLPITVHEKSFTGPAARIGFITSASELQLLLLGKRFDFSRLQISEEYSEFEDFSSFCQKASAKLIIALKFFQRKPYRLALVQEGFLPDFPKKELDRIVERLFMRPAIFIKNAPFEWNWRLATMVERSFAGLTEPTNMIATIKRSPGAIIVQKDDQTASQIPVDRIRVDLDINTSPNNVTARFEEHQIAGFFETAVSWHENLSSEISSFIGWKAK